MRDKKCRAAGGVEPRPLRIFAAGDRKGRPYEMLRQIGKTAAGETATVFIRFYCFSYAAV